MMNKGTFALLLCCLLGTQAYVSDFAGKVAVVTGGSYGIGKATVLRLAQEGAHVVFCARDAHPTWFTGAQAAAEINADCTVEASGGSATFYQADVREISEVRALFDYAHAEFGFVDMAVNNAGVGGYHKALHTWDDSNIMGEHSAITSNFIGVLNCLLVETQYYMTNGQASGTYSIVNLDSYYSERGCADCVGYSASKHAVHSLTRSIALTYASTEPIIRVNAIAPGLTNTAMVRNEAKLYMDPPMETWEGPLIEETDPAWLIMAAQYEDFLIGKRIAEPSDIASAIRFLLHQDSNYLNGAQYHTDNVQSAY